MSPNGLGGIIQLIDKFFQGSYPQSTLTYASSCHFHHSHSFLIHPNHIHFPSIPSQSSTYASISHPHYYPPTSPLSILPSSPIHPTILHSNIPSSTSPPNTSPSSYHPPTNPSHLQSKSIKQPTSNNALNTSYTPLNEIPTY